MFDRLPTFSGQKLTMKKIWPFLLLLASAPVQAAEGEGPPTQQRQRELIHMVRQDCGSCHGMTLKGGLGSPLLPENLHDKPVEGLVATILQGRPDSAMPPWKSLLTETEAEWIVRKLMTGFPKEEQ